MEKILIEELFINVIEPSLTQQHVINKQLKSLKINNTKFSNHGNDALVSLAKNKPDLVISSMYLPDMSGIELIYAIRSHPRLFDLPFMLISSETSFKMLDPIRQAGVVAILPKPFSAKELYKALHTTTEFICTDNSSLDSINIEYLETLVVDDSAVARTHITHVLNNLGINKITYAENGKIAIEKINAHFFDLIITDYNMPEMDGVTLIQQIRNCSSQKSIPILMVTSEDDSSRLAAVQQAGVSGICDKPFETETVKLLIKRMIA